MYISLIAFRIHPEAVDKYKDRLVKIYNKDLCVWVNLFTPPVLIKSFAVSVKLSSALNYTRNFVSNIEFHFEDNLGEDTPKVSDYLPEDLCNFPHIKFDS